eukprot:646452-Pleurochrysis_carterae.AAC.1
MCESERESVRGVKVSEGGRSRAHFHRQSGLVLERREGRACQGRSAAVRMGTAEGGKRNDVMGCERQEHALRKIQNNKRTTQNKKREIQERRE